MAVRNLFHKVSVAPSTRHVRIEHGGRVVAETDRALVLTETGLGDRLYIPVEDVRTDLILATDSHTTCPFKGVASYWAFADDESVRDAAWAYPEPKEDVAGITDHLSFYDEGVETYVDGVRR
ncbi:DUF427 domain-containing protein [Actinopolymorpha rutila]|uniref:Uncharacterized protein (DUF427 family) n=1 Tax=Actinopolymorpha rutila TaxID=446787 RepID=A0A852ZK98_9ACTN|nr:DUF427 domain-containing protein [Actinopolymorpha rutila]NYH92555.1 uncharacterized protein (DUF427 family) [Actinopolymorpha rutila]